MSYLRSNGCQRVQAYLFGRPIVAEGLAPMLHESDSVHRDASSGSG